jgi:hypothetical protein
MAVENRERLEEPRVKRLRALSPVPRVAPGPTPRGMGVERLVLLLVAFMSLLTLVSWRYHYGIWNYGRFILDQVLPASGIEDYIRTTFLCEIPKLDDASLANFGNPCFPQYDLGFQNQMSPVGSDYLALHPRDPSREGSVPEQGCSDL